jgi:hypothetical protein
MPFHDVVGTPYPEGLSKMKPRQISDLIKLSLPLGSPFSDIQPLLALGKSFFERLSFL